MGVCQYRFYGSKSHRQNHSKLLMSKWQKRILKPKLIYSSITYSLYELHLKGQVHFLQQYFCFKTKRVLKGKHWPSVKLFLKPKFLQNQSQYGIVQHNVTGVVNLARNIQKPAEPDQDFDQLVADMKNQDLNTKRQKYFYGSQQYIRDKEYYYNWEAIFMKNDDDRNGIVQKLMIDLYIVWCEFI